MESDEQNENKNKIELRKKEKLMNRKRVRENTHGQIEENDITNKNRSKENKNTIENELEEIKTNTQYWDKINNENIKEIITSNKEFIFGNYNQFYYNRFIETLKDSRVSVFKEEWFKDKNCLDIGCNDGTVANMIAVCFQPKLIEGIDIDHRLVNKAIKNMKYVMRNNLSKNYFDEILNLNKNQLNNDNSQMMIDEQNRIESNLKDKLNESTKMKEILNKLQNMPKSFLLSLGYHNNSNLLDKSQKLSNIKNLNNENFPNNIFFHQENYVAKIKEEEKYDTILCLNLVKWIHLNYGDIGVKLLFYNIYKQLKIGGLLILEPQDWKSYKKRKNMTQTFKTNFSEIKLRPELFKDYLENTIGFKFLMMTNPPSNYKKNFDRPIYVFQK